MIDAFTRVTSHRHRVTPGAILKAPSFSVTVKSLDPLPAGGM